MTRQWYHEPPFITQVSGGDTYAINVKLRDRTAMHDAHDLITKAFLEGIAAWGSGQVDWQARAEAAESLNARQAEALSDKAIEQLARNCAVAAVDCEHGYTMEKLREKTGKSAAQGQRA